MQQKLKTAIVGALGYAGFELGQILAKHPRVSAPMLFTRSETGAGATLDLVYPHAMNGHPTRLHQFSMDALKRESIDLLFLATPHSASWEIVPEALTNGLRVIDLSGAWRLKDESNRAIYKLPEMAASAGTMQQSVYGSPELNSSAIAAARLVANPGCYATSVILALAPFVKSGMADLDCGIVCDCKSGVSGAGREPSAKTHFVEVAENLSAYSVFGHRHTGEILEQLGIAAEQLIFTPHLLPIPRGILSTIYLRLKESATPEHIEQALRSFYADSKSVRIFPHPSLPQIQYSLRTNYCDLGFALSPDGKRLVLVSCLDNLIKGAAGQAVQNMNLMYGWNEQEGLN
ncbi:MAG: N-acetyl-gamma-glutamyl-phosphate reductase [Acidobacteriales bacterium]|nr:N-acetyl-gamma-glutamyl-phosphate reductase [Terriglobales bacterium]